MQRPPRIVRVPFLIPTWAAAQVPFPETILVRKGVELTVRLLAHELAHVDQWRRHGYGFAAKYAWQLVRHGYRNAPFEVEARAAEMNVAYRGRAKALLEGLISRGET